MNYLRKLVIFNSSNGLKFSNLLFENSINCFNDINEMLNDSEYLSCIFRCIIYGNFNSRCKKNQSINERLCNIQNEEFHQITSEFETFQRIKMPIDKILFLCLFINFIIIIYFTM